MFHSCLAMDGICNLLLTQLATHEQDVRLECHGFDCTFFEDVANIDKVEGSRDVKRERREEKRERERERERDR